MHVLLQMAWDHFIPCTLSYEHALVSLSGTFHFQWKNNAFWFEKKHLVQKVQLYIYLLYVWVEYLVMTMCKVSEK